MIPIGVGFLYIYIVHDFPFADIIGISIFFIGFILMAKYGS